MIIRVLSRALKNRRAVLIGALVVCVFIVIMGLAPHVLLLGAVASYPRLVAALFLSTFSALGTGELLIFFLTVLLLFVHITLLVFYIQKKKTLGSIGLAPAGLSGIIASLFGIGCASCGTVIGSSLLGVFGASGLLAALPFGGLELSALGIVIFVFSIYYLAKKINDPNVCEV